MEGFKSKMPKFDFKDLYEKFKDSCYEYFKPLKELAKGSIVKTIAILFVLWFFCMTPIWFSGIVILIVGPASFWQGFSMFIILMVIFGIPQLILAILAGMATVLIIDDQYQDGLMSNIIINDNPQTNTKSASKKSKKYQPKEQNSEKTGFGIPDDD